MSPTTSFPFGIAAIFKNEAPYLIEWLAHHRVLGIDRFFLADNESNDGTAELLQALQQAGVVRFVHVPTSAGSPQGAGYRMILEAFGAHADWLAFMDADEFLMPAEEGFDLAGWFRALAAPDVGAVALNWAVYGSSGRVYADDGPVQSRFRFRAPASFESHHHVKSILRLTALSDNVRPHTSSLRPGFRYLQADGQDFRVRDHYQDQSGDGLSQRLCWSPVRVNHYVIKSWVEYFYKKSSRGSAAGAGGAYQADFFYFHDHNDVEDAPSEAHQERVRREAAWIREMVARNAPGLLERFDANQLQLQGFKPPPGLVTGCVDEVWWEAGTLCLKGWALVRRSTFPLDMQVHVNGVGWPVAECVRMARPDVRLHHPRAPLDCGFVIRLEAAQAAVPLQALRVDVPPLAGVEPESLPLGAFVVRDSLVRPVGL
ncbi:glycosyltransferase family 2 protein [Hydrogenophaga electricum]|uniref:Glycosyltransferase family 2 protein n=2 Tax=Hydrogenophaga TaxID=47420 RepID=A0ABQ6C0V3_9BURK|nr:glycosyltransferase family 2 protein [Hydrogenophaga electricum]GLS13877.1 hypothetical protein GCM10007935_13070 [Hydrogenophaga electricum]